MTTTMKSERGFTLIEALIATTIMVTITAAVFAVLNPATGSFQTQPEVADIQQRLRVGTDQIHHDLLNAGAGSYSGLNDTFASPKIRSLMNYFAPVLPYVQSADANDDGQEHFFANRITIIYVPSTALQTTLKDGMATPSTSTIQVNSESGCPLTGANKDPLCGFKANSATVAGTKAVIYDGTGAFDTFVVTAVDELTANLDLQHSQQGTFSKAYKVPTRISEISYHAYYLNTTTKQLMHDDGLSVAAPILDNVVGLDFEYYGDPLPPAFLKANSTDYSTTYGPAPPGLGVLPVGSTWPAGENCTWTTAGSGANQTYVPRLASMGSGGNGLVKLSATDLTNGPWCPDQANSNHYDADLLRVRKIRVIEARDQTEAVAALQTVRPGVVLSDLRLPNGDGFGVLRAAKELDPDLPVIVMTAFGSIQDAVSAMREGALDFLAKPVDPDHLLLMVERALAQRRLSTENILLKEELASRRGAPHIVGEDPRLKQVSLALQRAAGTDTTMLLEGESGTGKELFARALHALSPRADGPFVAINCAAIPETLLETELFGHEKGAFTGAANRKPGKFELAHRGTLFLDEIGELPLALQAKILRALEEKKFERVGGTTLLQVDVRIVAATNRNLRQAVANRQFREDLFFRLSVFPITIPPLRERRSDIPMLARYFIERFCRDLNKKPLSFAQSAVDEMQTYEWPGNVRELQNCIERAVILTEGDTIHARHLSLSFRDAAPAAAADDSPWAQIDLSGTMAAATARVVAEVERRKIEQALAEAGGNRAKAAESLQLGFKDLTSKLREHGLEG